MMLKLIALTLVCAVTVVALIFFGVPQKGMAFAIVSSLEKRQGLQATISQVRITGVNRLTIDDLVIFDEEKSSEIIVFDRIDVVFNLSRLLDGVHAAEEVIIDGGRIKVDEARRVARKRRDSVKRRPRAVDAPSSAPLSLVDGASTALRRISFSDLKLDGGKKRIGISIFKTTVKMVIDDVEGELTQFSDKVVVHRVTGSVAGVRLPEAKNLEFSPDSFSNPDSMGPVPGPLRGALVALGLLLGGRVER